MYTRVHLVGNTKGVVSTGAAVGTGDEFGTRDAVIIAAGELVDGADIAEVVELGPLGFKMMCYM